MTMKMILRPALISLLLLTSSAATLQAQGTEGFFPRQAIESWSGSRFTIQRLDFLRKRDIFRNLVINWASSHPREVHALQGTIRSNRALSRALRSQSVEINNIVGVQSAMNGHLVLYLR
jgi:hypothetical protein